MRRTLPLLACALAALPAEEAQPDAPTAEAAAPPAETARAEPPALPQADVETAAAAVAAATTGTAAATVGAGEPTKVLAAGAAEVLGAAGSSRAERSRSSWDAEA